MPTLFMRAIAVLSMASLLTCGKEERPSENPYLTKQSSVINPTTEAGESATGFDVNQDGRAQFSIPLKAPPGIGAAQLKLALTYSSGRGRGALGKDWGLSGLSELRRCPRRYAKDGFVDPIALTANDRLCLDGVELQLVSGTYGAPSAEYALEFDSFTRVYAGSTSPVMTYTAKTKEGLTQTYGLVPGVSGGTVSAPESGNVPWRWLLTQVEDRGGNSLVYRYATGLGNARLFEVRGGISNGMDPKWKLELWSEFRATDEETDSYFRGSRIIDEARYTHFQFVDWETNEIIRKYVLDYETDTWTRQRRLRSVQECAGTTCFAPVSVMYSQTLGDSKYDFQLPDTEIDSSGVRPGLVTLDVNGDGKSDLLWCRIRVINPGAPNQQAFCDWTLKPSTGTTFTPGIVVTVGNVDNHIRPLTGTFSGSGRTEALIPNTESKYVLVQSSAGPSAPQTTQTDLPFFGSNAAADLDGDGLTDLVIVDPNLGGTIAFRRNTTMGGVVSFAAPVTMLTAAPNERFTEGRNNPTFYNNTPAILGAPVPEGYPGGVRTADFNGDGRADLWVTRKVGDETCNSPTSQAFPTCNFNSQVYLSNGVSAGNTFAPLTLFASFVGGLHPGRYGYRILNWNGDSCADYVSTGHVFVSNCLNGFVTAAILPSVNADLVGDVTDDDRDDIVNSASIGSGPSAGPTFGPVTVYASQGNSGNVNDSFRTTSFAIQSPIALAGQFADINGDGKLDLLHQDPAQSWFLLVTLNKDVNPAGAPTEFKNGLGARTQLSYRLMSSPSMYAPATGAVFPEVESTTAGYMLSRVLRDDGNGGQYAVDYFYAGGRVHLQGRGFEGFAERRVLDTRDQTLTIEHYRRQFPSTGMLEDRRVQGPVNDVLGFGPDLSVTLNTLVVRTTGTGTQQRYFRFTDTTTTTSYESSPSKAGPIKRVATAVDFDAFGNEISNTITLTDLDATAPASPFVNQQWQTTTTREFENDTSSNWCVGQPRNAITTSTAPGKAPRSRRTDYETDSTRCRVIETRTNDDRDARYRTRTTIDGFDPCGNPTGQTVWGHASTGAALAPRSTFTQWGPRCQLPEQTRRIGFGGMPRTFTYDYNLGLPLTSKDENNLTTTYVYDDYGRQTRITRPDNTYATTTYERQPGTPSRPMRVTTREYDANGQLLNTEYEEFDILGRVRTTHDQQAPMGSPLRVDTTYDSHGRISRQELPYRTVPEGYRVTTYDLLDRPTAERTHDASGELKRRITYEYQGQTSRTFDTLNKEQRRVNDVTGALRRVTDAMNQTARYEYDSLGNRTTIVSVDDTTSTFEHDVNGHTFHAVEPNRGETWTVHNSLGEIEAVGDAKHQTTRYFYDDFGRLRRREENEGVTEWTWGISLPRVNRLTRVTAPDYVQDREYDGLGRLERKVTRLDAEAGPQSQTFTWDYTYDSAGQLATTSYPHIPGGPPRFVARNTYTFGELTEIKDTNSQALWRLSAQTPTGQPLHSRVFPDTAIVTGNEIRIARTYKPVTHELESITSGTTNALSSLQNLSYAWDEGGRLTNRQDLNRGLLEEFSHDDLYRLTWTRINGVLNSVAPYNSGKLAMKFDVGGYSYHDPAHPHGATRAGVRTFEYDANGNVQTRDGVEQLWASYDMPWVLATGGARVDLTYGPSHERVKQVSSTRTYSYVAGVPLVNGGFEQPALPAGGFAYSPNPQVGWMHVGAGIQRNGSVWGAAAAPEGSQTLVVQGKVYAEQSVPVNQPGLYAVRLMAARRWWQGSTTPQVVRVMVDGSTVGTVSPTEWASYQSFTTAAFFLPVANHTLRLEGQTDADVTVFIDQVELVSAVPQVPTGPVVLNPSFEEQLVTFSSWCTSSWGCGGTGTVTTNGPQSPYAPPPAPHGTQSLAIQSQGLVEQTITIPTAGTYAINVWVAKRAYQATSESQTLEVTWDSKFIAQLRPTDTARFRLFTTRAFTTTSGGHVLRFRGQAASDTTAFIDSISVVPVTGDTTSFVDELLEKTVSASGVTTWRMLVPTPSGETVTMTTTIDGTNVTTTRSVVLKDHLHSTDVVADYGVAASLSAPTSFDAYGARRGLNWINGPTNAQVSAVTARTREGYTSHDSLDALGLVHMGARVYDPHVGQFLSVDKVIDLTDPQSLNPYSYVRNRPLTHTDPSGLEPEPLFDNSSWFGSQDYFNAWASSWSSVFDTGLYDGWGPSVGGDGLQADHVFTIYGKRIPSTSTDTTVGSDVELATAPLLVTMVFYVGSDAVTRGANERMLYLGLKHAFNNAQTDRFSPANRFNGYNLARQAVIAARQAGYKFPPGLSANLSMMAKHHPNFPPGTMTALQARKAAAQAAGSVSAAAYLQRNAFIVSATYQALMTKLGVGGAGAAGAGGAGAAGGFANPYVLLAVGVGLTTNVLTTMAYENNTLGLQTGVSALVDRVVEFTHPTSHLMKGP